MRRTTRKTTKTKRTASATMKRAQRILQEQKNEYQSIFRHEIRKGGDPKKAAVRAGSVYRSTFGNTATTRWKRALRAAQN